MEKTKQENCCNTEASRNSDVKSYIMIGILAIILLVLVIQSFQINSIKLSAVAAVTGAGVLDMSGWSEDEKMQYEHHNTLPARLQGSANNAKSAPSMVGGC